MTYREVSFRLSANEALEELDSLQQSLGFIPRFYAVRWATRSRDPLDPWDVIFWSEHAASVSRAGYYGLRREAAHCLAWPFQLGIDGLLQVGFCSRQRRRAGVLEEEVKTSVLSEGVFSRSTSLEPLIAEVESSAVTASK
jgi:hypothetical protein